MKKLYTSLLIQLYTVLLKLKSKMAYHYWIGFYKKEFKKIGSFFSIMQPARVINPKYITIGENFYSLSNLRIEAIDDFTGFRHNPEIIIGDNVDFNSDCHIAAIDKVHIGNNVLLASKVFITDHSHGEINDFDIKISPSKRKLFSKGPVIIKDNVWIGEGACILSGVTIGENSIIGANSVVTKDIPANAVAAGIPAKVLKILN